MGINPRGAPLRSAPPRTAPQHNATSHPVIELRDYQHAAIQSLYDWFGEKTGNPLVVVPTGGGKSLIMAGFIRSVLEQFPRERILVLTHVKELIQQNYDALKAYWPDAPAGIYSAGLGKRDAQAQVLFGGIQSTHKKADKIGWADLILIDEAHLIPRKGFGMYRTMLNALLSMNHNLKVIGLTATPFRTGEGRLDAGDDRLFHGTAYTVDLSDLIERGFLSPIRAKDTEAKIDTRGVHRRGGDFIESELQDAAMDTDKVATACAEIVRRGEGRKSWLVFCCGVEHAKAVADELECAHGIDCATVFGDTPAQERDRILRDYKAGRIRAVANMNVLTTGFDAPQTDLIALLRPTLSPVLYVQMVGRGLRIAPAKTDCVARGTPILTDRGEVPIEALTTDMLVWDGVEFVRHDGAVCKGYRSVIRYAGLTATPDHKVWTRHGWKPFEWCFSTHQGIMVGSSQGLPVREADGLERRPDEGSPSVLQDSVQGVRTDLLPRKGVDRPGDRGLSPLLEPESGPEMARGSMLIGEGAMRQSAQSGLPTIRRQGDPVLLRFTDSDGSVDYVQHEAREKQPDRPNQQRSRLRTREHQVCVGSYEHSEYEKPEHSHHAQVQDGPPRDPVRRLNTSEDDFVRDGLAGDRREVLPAIVETEREVWDILNAGPRHRFVASGLIVSNCLVLDFGGNFMRHGPIDDVQTVEPDSGEGEGGTAPFKVCPQCSAYCHTRAKQCLDCGYEWPDEPAEAKHDVRPNEEAEFVAPKRNPIERWQVQGESYKRWDGKEGKPDTLCAEYYCGLNRTLREWVCFDHAPGSFPRRKADEWWRDRLGKFPSPVSVDEALVRIECEELRQLHEVVVDTRGKYMKCLARVPEIEPGEREPDYGRKDARNDVDLSDLPF